MKTFGEISRQTDRQSYSSVIFAYNKIVKFAI